MHAWRQPLWMHWDLTHTHTLPSTLGLLQKCIGQPHPVISINLHVYIYIKQNVSLACVVCAASTSETFTVCVGGQGFFTPDINMHMQFHSSYIYIYICMYFCTCLACVILYMMFIFFALLLCVMTHPFPYLLCAGL